MKNIHSKIRKHKNATLAAQIDELRTNIENADSPESAKEILNSFIAETTDNPVKNWLVEFQTIFNNFGAETGGAQCPK